MKKKTQTLVYDLQLAWQVKWNFKRKKICVKAELKKGGRYQKSKIKGELISSAE